MRKIKVMNLGFRSESGRVRKKNILINARKEKPSRNIEFGKQNGDG